MSFSKSAQYYDRIYSWKDYEKESQEIVKLIHSNLKSNGNRLLEVACGTGLHIELLKSEFDIEGLDIEPQLLDIARARNPGIVFHHADMTDFDLGTRFDIITCLFSSIGYVKTVDNLHKAICCFQHHLVLGGTLLVEPWFTPETWIPKTVHALFVDEPELKIARINTSSVDGLLSYFDLHYLIGTPEKTEHFVEHHEMGLFTIQEMLDAFHHANLEVEYDPNGLMGRGLYIAQINMA
jgi:ubiquinone/menaquinone biosynthesis C-methylase UbiE